MKYQRLPTPVRSCDYLPDRKSCMVFAEVDSLSSREYLDLINKRWRRFGYWLFRPECPSCRACQPIRVPAREYSPNRNQRRVIKRNSQLVRLEIGKPSLDEARIELYVDHHNYRARTRGWRPSNEDQALHSMLNFTISPLPVQEWAYYLNDELVAIAYIDQLPDGFSGIYFYHSPLHARLSLGNWICISMILKAQELNFDYVYFGYYVKGNISMEYKATFAPNQILQEDGSWQYFFNG
jgi:leucyl-tRNA---protein transferase